MTNADDRSNYELPAPRVPDTSSAAGPIPIALPTVIRFEASSPIWRLLAVAALFGAMFAFGTWAAELGQQWLDNIAMIITLTILSTIRFVIRHKHDKTIQSFGPFSKIAKAVNESMGEIQDFIDRKTLAFGVAVALLLAILTVILKVIVSLLLASFSSPWLAAFAGLLVASIVVLPSLYATVGKAFKGR